MDRDPSSHSPETEATPMQKLGEIALTALGAYIGIKIGGEILGSGLPNGTAVGVAAGVGLAISGSK